MNTSKNINSNPDLLAELTKLLSSKTSIPEAFKIAQRINMDQLRFLRDNDCIGSDFFRIVCAEMSDVWKLDLHTLDAVDAQRLWCPTDEIKSFIENGVTIEEFNRDVNDKVKVLISEAKMISRL